jgi:cyanophycinase-like exopeptidase
MRIFTGLVFVLISLCSNAQNYTSYFTGDTTDADVIPQFGIVLAGGATDSDNAMQWFLERANGGDVVVIRASGADGYNDYLYSELGVNVNSVETIRFQNANASNDAYVIQQLSNAEAIFIAGGDQGVYVDYWKDTPIENILNDHANVKQGVIGGTSAGMAILGGHYFRAQNGTVYSDEALEDPYNSYMTIGHQDFLMMPYLHDVITDTHFDDPDRRGRLLTFLARIYADGYPMALGIACNEYVAVVIGENGVAYGYGEWPDYDEYAYFARHGCGENITPETCEDNQPLTWNHDESATYVFQMNAELAGSSLFDLNDWMSANGGNWQEWWAQDGNATFDEVSFGPTCPLEMVSSVSEFTSDDFQLYPSPCDDLLHVILNSSSSDKKWTVRDIHGRIIKSGNVSAISSGIDTSDWSEGVYWMSSGNQTKSFVVLHR